MVTSLVDKLKRITEKTKILEQKGIEVNNAEAALKAKTQERIRFDSFHSINTPKCLYPVEMPLNRGKIGNTNVTIAHGNMTDICADAYLVPQFNNSASFGGVGGSVARSGAEKGIEAYNNIVKKLGTQEFGTIHITESHGGKSSRLIHAVTVGSGKENEFEIVEKAVYNALKKAQEHGIKSVVMPEIGTGIIGNLTDAQSANAMMRGIRKFSAEGGKMDICIDIFRNQQGFSEFSKILNNATYDVPISKTGGRKFDIGRFIDEINI